MNNKAFLCTLLKLKEKISTPIAKISHSADGANWFLEFYLGSFFEVKWSEGNKILMKILRENCLWN